MEIYDGFSDWKDVQSQFEDQTPEPDEVLCAVYDGGGYEGDALVIYRNGEKYFIVQGSHCSCYGLEGQFDPTEYPDKDTFAKCLAPMKFYYGEQEKAKERILAQLKDSK